MYVVNPNTPLIGFFPETHKRNVEMTTLRGFEEKGLLQAETRKWIRMPVEYAEKRKRSQMTHDARMFVCGNILLDVGITRQQSERASEQTKPKRLIR